MLPGSERLSQCLNAHTLFQGQDDVEETSARVGQIFRPHRLGVLGNRQRLSAEMNHAKIGGISVSRLCYRADVTIQSEPLDSFLLLMVPLTGTAEITHQGQRMVSTPQRASVISPQTNLSMRWQQDCEQLIFRMDRRALERTCEAHLGRPLGRSLSFDLSLDLAQTHTASLQSVIGFLVSTEPLIGHSGNVPLVVAQAEQLLFSALLNCHGNTYRDELLQPVKQIAPRHVKRCEEYIQAHAGDALTLEDLAQVAGVSTRSLQAAFRQYRDTTPMAYLKRIRLQKVRETLQMAKTEADRTESVSRAAMSWGFGHMGHFTRDYADAFGELPSTTLGR